MERLPTVDSFRIARFVRFFEEMKEVAPSLADFIAADIVIEAAKSRDFLKLQRLSFLQDLVPGVVMRDVEEDGREELEARRADSMCELFDYIDKEQGTLHRGFFAVLLPEYRVAENDG